VRLCAGSARSCAGRSRPGHPCVRQLRIPLLLLCLLSLLPAAAHAREFRDDPGPETSPGRQGGPSPAAHPLDTRDIAELLVLANQKYLEGDFAEATRGYETIAALGHANGHVFYNLGNSYVRLGETGRAILNYRKALLLTPRDGDLKANLQYARSLCQDRIEPAASSIWRTLAFWHFGLNLRGLLFGFLLLHALFWGFLFLRLFLDREWLQWSIALSLILSLLAAASSAVKYRETYHNPGGVILVSEATVRAGFTHHDTALFILHQGAEFRILDAEGGWWKIELPDGKKGWLPAEAAGRVSLGSA